MKRLLALTIFPEWTYGICYLGKDRENRGRMPPKALIGEWFALHGGANIGGIHVGNGKNAGLQKRQQYVAMQTMLARARQAGAQIPERDLRLSDVLERGRGIVALARLAGVDLPTTTPKGWHDTNAFGLQLADVQVLREPVAARGMPGFWPVPDDLLGPIFDRLPAAAPQALRICLQEVWLGE